jgi:hypothetical protein
VKALAACAKRFTQVTAGHASGDLTDEFHPSRREPFSTEGWPHRCSDRGRRALEGVSMMVLNTRDLPSDDSPVPGIIPAPTHVVRGDAPAEDERGDRRRREAARRPLIARARALWPRRRTDRH